MPEQAVRLFPWNEAFPRDEYVASGDRLQKLPVQLHGSLAGFKGFSI